MGNINNTTTSKWLNQDLNLSYKKTNKINNSLRDSYFEINFHSNQTWGRKLSFCLCWLV